MTSQDRMENKKQGEIEKKIYKIFLVANAQGNETIHPTQQFSSTVSPTQQEKMGDTGSLQKGGGEGEPSSGRGRLPALWKCVIVAIMLNNLNDVSVHDSKALVWEAVEVIGNDSPQ